MLHMRAVCQAVNSRGVQPLQMWSGLSWCLSAAMLCNLSLPVTPAADAEQPGSDLCGRPVGSGMHLVSDVGGAPPLQGWHRVPHLPAHSHRSSGHAHIALLTCPRLAAPLAASRSKPEAGSDHLLAACHCISMCRLTACTGLLHLTASPRAG